MSQPYALPPQGRPLRVAFVGAPLRFTSWALHEPACGLDPTFVPFSPGDKPAGLATRLHRLAPHVVVLLDVDALPAAELASLDAAIVGVAATGDSPPEPKARPGGEAMAGTVPIVDRLVAVDPAAAAGRELWRLLTPPVDDRLFAEPRLTEGPAARVVFAAPSTAHREQLLTTAKHEHDVLHVAHGTTPETLPCLLATTDVSIVLRPHPGPGFDHAVALHLAAGHLVITDPLEPAHGLEAGIDLLVADSAAALARAVGAARTAPGAHHRVRVRGHQKAQRFRASRVWPELIEDLLADLEAFGPGREEA